MWEEEPRIPAWAFIVRVDMCISRGMLLAAVARKEVGGGGTVKWPESMAMALGCPMLLEGVVA